MVTPTDIALQSDQVLKRAADLFRLMSAPMRLKIITALCQSEKNVTELLACVATTQPNMSQHLKTLYKAGILGKRRGGVQIYYHIANPHVTALCRAVCSQVASDMVAVGEVNT